MPKSRPSLRPILFVLALNLLACKALSLPLWDLSTDDGVLQAYNTITEQNLSSSDVCISRPTGLQEVIVIGVFAYDAGCLGDEGGQGAELGGKCEGAQPGLGVAAALPLQADEQADGKAGDEGVERGGHGSVRRYRGSIGVMISL